MVCFERFVIINIMKYVPTIGLEIHAELKTQTKMFCDCLSAGGGSASGGNDPQERHPNINVCPICLGHPGTLPVINKQAVEAVLKVGMALNGDIPAHSKFDRKNYFYPDLPKGYQISQYDLPLVFGGMLKGVRLRRIHLEEDAGRLIHSAPLSNGSRMNSNESRIFEKDSIKLEKDSRASYVDFNRAGVPLMELVTEPDIKSAEQAVEFAKELQLILRYLEVSDADMEKGQMRVEANISLSNPSRIESNESRIVLKDDSYDLMGQLFEVQNKLGPIYKEKNYQDAIEEVLKRDQIPYEREKLIKLKFENLEVSDFFADFVINNKILLEVKAKPFITNDDIRQTSRYIKSLELPLGIVANFKKQKLEYRRVVNPAFEKDSSSFEENSRNELGTKVEVKNINSFKAVHDAIEYEIKRQAELLDKGEKIHQETRGWDDVHFKTVSQRSKEEAHDYRYFPEPDLPPLDLSKFDLTAIKASIPELPQEKRVRFAKEFNLKPEQIEILIADREMANFFEESISELETEDKENLRKETELILNYLTSDLRGVMAEQGIDFRENKLTPENFADLIELISHGKISSRTAKDLLREMADKGGDPNTLLQEKGLEQISDERELAAVVKKIIEANPAAVSDYKKGKETALQFLVGKAMGELKGKGNPAILQKLFKEALR